MTINDDILSENSNYGTEAKLTTSWNLLQKVTISNHNVTHLISSDKSTPLRALEIRTVSYSVGTRARDSNNKVFM